MKKSILSILALALTLGSCTKNFDDINTDPNQVEDLEPGYQLTRMWMRYNGSPHEEHRGNLIMSGPLSGIVQSGYRTGQGFSVTNDSYNEAKMMEMYRDAIKNGVDMVTRLHADKEEDNSAKLAIATIGLQFQYQRVTDLHGDVPYHDAGMGYHDRNFYPKYDTQEDIYHSMVDSLKKYRDILLTTDAPSFPAEQDIIFGGHEDAGRKAAWAKTANSLIMRLGMRASTADAAWAQEVVEEAANHQAGFITSVNHNEGAIMKTGQAGGDWGMHINGANSALNNWGYVFVGDEWLRRAQRNRDPRIFYTTAQAIIDGTGMHAWTGQSEFDAFEEAAKPGEDWKPVVFTPERGGGDESYSVRGMMSIEKVDENGDVKVVRQYCDYYVNSENDPEFAQYHTLAAVNPETLGNKEAPIVIFAGDESYYILAEAAQRGWNVPGTAATNLEQALRLTFDKYPALFSFGNSPEKYMEMQAAHEGQPIVYSDLAETYIQNVLAQPMDLDLIWVERWKSLLTTYTYEAFPLWNRTNLSAVPTGIHYTREIELPFYTEEELLNPVMGQSIPASSFVTEPFHNGGDTEGVRPRRLDYPNTERANNGTHVDEAVTRQRADFGSRANAFATTNMWISAKN